MEIKPQSVQQEQNKEEKPQQVENKPQSLKDELEGVSSQSANVQNQIGQEENKQESVVQNTNQSKPQEKSLQIQHVVQSAEKNQNEQIKPSPSEQTKEDVKEALNIEEKTEASNINNNTEPIDPLESPKQPLKTQQVNISTIASQPTLAVSQDSSQKTQQATHFIQKQSHNIPEKIAEVKLEESANHPKTHEQLKIPTETSSERLEKQASKAKDQQANTRKRRKRVFKDKQKQEQNPQSLDQQKPKILSNDQIEQPIKSSQQPTQVVPPRQPLRPSQSVHSILQEYHSDHQEDTRVLSDTSFSKKKENYFQLREWSKMRTEQTALHLNIVDQLQTQLQRAIKSSMENIDMYAAFFRQRADQEDKYASHPIINTHFATQSNDLSKDVYINCSRLLNSLGDESLERCKKSQILAIFIRKNILIDHIEDHIKRTHLELLKIREKVSTVRQALIKCTADVDRKITKLAVRYNQYVTKLGYDLNKDFLKGQLSFLRKAFEQTQIQKKLGLLVFDYLKIASDEEIKRANIIKNCLRLYIEAMVVTYAITPDTDSIKQLDKEEELKLIPQFYAVQDLLDDRFLEVLKKTMNLEGKDLSVTLLFGYLNTFKFLHFNSRILVLKEYPIVYEETKDKLNDGRLMVSVDNYIHVFFDDDNTPYPKPSVSFKINGTLEIKSSRDLSVELRRKEEKRGVMSYLMWTPKTQPPFVVRFLKRDALQEFEEFVIKLV